VWPAPPAQVEKWMLNRVQHDGWWNLLLSGRLGETSCCPESDLRFIHIGTAARQGV
jgi:hypothetical protein